MSNPCGYKGLSFGNVLENEKAHNPAPDLFYPKCEICGKNRFKPNNHERCSRIRQKKYSKDKK